MIYQMDKVMKKTIGDVLARSLHDPILHKCFGYWYQNPNLTPEEFLIIAVLALSERNQILTDKFLKNIQTIPSYSMEF